MSHDKKPGSDGEQDSRSDRLAIVRELVEGCRSKLNEKIPTISDFIRLLSLEHELTGEEKVNEVTVRWVQSLEVESEK